MTHEGGEAAGQPATILECDPPRRLAIEFEQQDAENMRLDLDLWAEEGRTVLRFVQFFPAAADVTDWAMGWHWYLDRLGAEIDGGTPPTDWDAFVADVGPAYGRSPS